MAIQPTPTTRLSVTANELTRYDDLLAAAIATELDNLDTLVDGNGPTTSGSIEHHARLVAELRRMRAKVNAGQDRLDAGIVAGDEDPDDERRGVGQ